MKKILLVGLMAAAAVFSAEAVGHKIRYRGNVEVGYTSQWSDFMKSDAFSIRLTTSHGVEVLPWLYTGVGVGVVCAYDYDSAAMCAPIFAHVRATYPCSGKFRPFGELRIGGLAGERSGFVTPAIGCEFAWSRRMGVYATIGTDIVYGYAHSLSGLTFALGLNF